MPCFPNHPQRLLRALLLVSLGLALSACAPRRAALPALTRHHAGVILVSIDGFRPDYLNRGVTPNLAQIAATGVRADAMRPAFPSLTFPNHYSLVTGLYPDHHGIVHNIIRDPSIAGNFVYNKAATTADGRWWGGEPIWVGAQRRGLRTATMFWPGSDVAIDGQRPNRWKAFDSHMPPDERVRTVLEWLDLPVSERPDFITLYFEQADRTGHDFGPDSAQVDAVLQRIDGAIGALRDGLAQRNLTDAINLIVVSDHGQSSSSPGRTIHLDETLDLDRVNPVTLGVVAGFAPDSGQQRYAESVLLKPHAHMDCWRKKAIPARFHYGSNPRIPPIICLAHPGWVITTSAWMAQHTDNFSLGEHGYDNATPDMRALFIASGPDFRQAIRVAEFDNVDVYPLLAHLLGVEPAPNDGNPDTMRPMLRDGGTR